MNTPTTKSRLKLKIVLLAVIVVVLAFGIADWLNYGKEFYAEEKDFDAFSEYIALSNQYGKLASVLIDGYFMAPFRIDSLINLQSPKRLFKTAEINFNSKEIETHSLPVKTWFNESEMQIEVNKSDSEYLKSVEGNLFIELMECKNSGDTTVQTMLFQSESFNNSELYSNMGKEYVQYKRHLDYGEQYYFYNFRYYRTFFNGFLADVMECEMVDGFCTDTIYTHNLEYDALTQKITQEIERNRKTFDSEANYGYLMKKFTTTTTAYQYDSLGRFAKIKHNENEFIFSYDRENSSDFVAKLTINNKAIGEYYYHKDENSESVRLTLPLGVFELKKTISAHKESIELKTIGALKNCYRKELFLYTDSGSLQHYYGHYSCSKKKYGKEFYEKEYEYNDTLNVEYDKKMRPQKVTHHLKRENSSDYNSTLKLQEKTYFYKYSE